MAQRQRRRRKHKGTQAGTVRRRGRTSRAQTRATADRRREQRQNEPPTWQSSIMRGAIAAAALCLLLVLIVGASVAGAIALSLVAAVIYVPAFHMVDSALYRRRMARRDRSEPE
jgi:Flp pilus assembly protein TadB